MAKKKETTGYTVLVPFKDSKEYGGLNSYEVGSDVSDFDAERLESLIKRGIVGKPEIED